MTAATLHVHCGDASAAALRKSGLDGDVLVWREIYVEGPVPGNLSREKFRDARAKFLGDFGMGRETALRGLKAMDAALDRAGDYAEIVLWFDACLFDQTIMIYLIDRLVKDRGKAKLSLICVGEFPGFSRFLGLGELSPEQLASLWPTRHELTPREIETASRAWAAFASDTPEKIESALVGETSSLPYLADALRRFLEQYPSVRNGLDRLKNQILSAVAAGNRGLIDIFKAVSDMEERPYFGDTSLWRRLSELASAPVPALRLEGPGDFAAFIHFDPKNYVAPSIEAISAWRVSLTPAGEDVLSGKKDFIALNGVDAWLGGVHLLGPEARRRWDEQAQRLITMF